MTPKRWNPSQERLSKEIVLLIKAAIDAGIRGVWNCMPAQMREALLGEFEKSGLSRTCDFVKENPLSDNIEPLCRWSDQ
jgi:hypothetical protein